MSGITTKKHGKKQKVFLIKLKQICVKLFENKLKTLEVASWKWSKLGNEKKNWEQ